MASPSFTINQKMTYNAGSGDVTMTANLGSGKVGEPFCRQTQIIPTGSWVALDVGEDVLDSYLFIAIIRNMDGNNPVSVSKTSDGSQEFAAIQPLEGLLLTLNAGDYTPYVRATGAAVRVEFLALSHTGVGAPG
jgi:hypothetical protein